MGFLSRIGRNGLNNLQEAIENWFPIILEKFTVQITLIRKALIGAAIFIGVSIVGSGIILRIGEYVIMKKIGEICKMEGRATREMYAEEAALTRKLLIIIACCVCACIAVTSKRQQQVNNSPTWKPQTPGRFATTASDGATTFFASEQHNSVTRLDHNTDQGPGPDIMVPKQHCAACGVG
ncbi:hypothetical protein K469DRAFT_755311, partial [Zopfia rhizophila CBS 207.26]